MKISWYEDWELDGVSGIGIGDVIEFDYMITNAQFPYRVNVKGKVIDRFTTINNKVFIHLDLIHYDGAAMRSHKQFFFEYSIIQGSIKKEQK